MSKKHNIEYIREKFKEKGYTLISEYYINNKQKLDYVCGRGHKHSIRWNDFEQGHLCPFCIDKNIKYTFEQVKEILDKFNYTLVSKKYINNESKLDCVCNKGHICKVTLSGFMRGRRCKICARQGKNNNYKGGVYNSNLPLYSTYSHQLAKYQLTYLVFQGGLGLLGVECSFCKKIFVPTASAVQERIRAINNVSKGDHNLYCSEKCKQDCPTYKKRKYRSGQKGVNNRRLDQAAWSKMVKDRDNNTCQRCGAQNEQMYAHHIYPVSINPIESADIDNGITLCYSCHKDMHSIIGCTLNELKCKEY